MNLHVSVITVSRFREQNTFGAEKLKKKDFVETAKYSHSVLTPASEGSIGNFDGLIEEGRQARLSPIGAMSRIVIRRFPCARDRVSKSSGGRSFE